MRAVPLLVALTLVGVACSGDRPTLTDDVAPPNDTVTTTTLEPPTTTDAPAAVTAPNGRTYPVVAADAVELGERLASIEQRLRGTDPGDPVYGDLADEQQMIYRTLGRSPDRLATVLEAMPTELVPVVEAHVAARVAIGGIGHGDPPENVPAWEIIEPLPADVLRGIYDEAAATTGIDWAYLAAINLLETGFGRIHGLSTAGAQGPMQFLPTTWEEVGEGSIDDPFDAIPASARYLVQRGGPDDMERALWGYNNSDSYVEAVSTYARMFRDDAAVFTQTHAWEIHYSAALADLWLPVGYRRDEPVPAVDHVAEAPWSLPPAG